MKFLLDNYLAPKHARAFHSLLAPEHEFANFRNHFSPNTSDQEWVSALIREQNWIVISGNIRMAKNPAEKVAWRATGVTAFFLHPGWANISMFDQHALLSRSLPGIIQSAQKAKPGTGYILFANRRIKQIY
jgi:hypothetical protein